MIKTSSEVTIWQKKEADALFSVLAGICRMSCSYSMTNVIWWCVKLCSSSTVHADDGGGKKAPPRPPQMARKHEPCLDTTHMNTNQFLKHIRELGWYADQVASSHVANCRLMSLYASKHSACHLPDNLPIFNFITSCLLVRWKAPVRCIQKHFFPKPVISEHETSVHFGLQCETCVHSSYVMLQVVQTEQKCLYKESQNK